MRFLTVLLLLVSLPPALSAAGPANPISTIFYDFNVRVLPKDHRFENDATLRLRNDGPDTVRQIFVALPSNARLHTVKNKDGALIRFEREWERVSLTLAGVLAPAETIDLTFHYDFEFHGKGNPLFQLSMNIEPGDSYSLLNWYPTARSILTYEDVLIEGDKAPFRMTLDVPAGETAVTMGRLVSHTLSGDRAQWTWESGPLRPAALFFVSGYYEKRLIHTGSMPIEFYLRRDQRAGELESLARIVSDTVAANTRRYGDLGIRPYRVISFGGEGARGYPGALLVAESSGYFDRSDGPDLFGMSDRRFVVAHEVSHTWWGNAVTGVGPGGNTLLSEGFATYAASRALGERDARQREWELVRAMRDSVLAGEVSHQPIVEVNNLSNAFTGDVYKRGALALYNLAYEIGEERLDAAMRSFFTRYRDGFASVAEFEREVLLLHPGVGWFFKQWFYSTRLPDVRVESWEAQAEGDKWRHHVVLVNRGDGRATFPLVFRDEKQENNAMEIRVQAEAGQVVKVDHLLNFRAASVVADPQGRIFQGRRVGALLVEAESLRQKGQLSEARTLLNSVLEVDPENARALYMLGRVSMVENQEDEAIKLFRRSIANYHGAGWIPVWSWIRLAQIHDLKGQRAQAVEAYRKALETGTDVNGSLETARRGLTSSGK
ncbi:MAG: M1 family aminopeptidase [Acidobacteriota bacterium]